VYWIKSSNCGICGLCVLFRDHEPFDLFTYGVDVYSTPRYKQEIEDRLHFFTEECDNLQVRFMNVCNILH